MRKFLILAALALTATGALAGAFEDGAAAYRHGDYRTAMIHWAALSQSDPTIQNNYGVMYVDGKGVKQNYGLALQWFSRSASAGSSLGQNNLSGMYRDGKGVPRDYRKAITFFQAAAQQGNAAAQVNLGLMEMNGQGVAQAVTNRNIVRQRLTAQGVAQGAQLSQRCRAMNFKNCG